eukprot:TRINITY_DN19561_c2_g1_i8.p1 TRINITY_DN19561_c2_g1~~TRINITY_DN19561_c2_g1_i8.p1  ORF type:complete len:128 (-),score=4.80 TRINITY_DN19561_c2_g1_i8:14-397(-)
MLGGRRSVNISFFQYTAYIPYLALNCPSFQQISVSFDVVNRYFLTAQGRLKNSSQNPCSTAHLKKLVQANIHTEIEQFQKKFSVPSKKQQQLFQRAWLDKRNYCSNICPGGRLTEWGVLFFGCLAQN